MEPTQTDNDSEIERDLEELILLSDESALIREHIERAYWFAEWYTRGHRYLDVDDVTTAAAVQV